MNQEKLYEKIVKIEDLGKKVEKIEKLKKAEFGSDEEIEAFLELDYDVQTILNMWEIQKDLLTIQQAVDMLNDALKGKETWSYDKVFRYLNDNKKTNGKIASIKIKNERRIKRSVLETFIEERTMTKQDYKEKFEESKKTNGRQISLLSQMRDELDKKVKVLEEENKQKDERIKELEEQLKALQPKPKQKTRGAKKEEEKETGKVE
ncbi:hypothetical protein BC30102_p808 (plasmid) [Bacillus cereus]|nr:hypothetical protein BC30102_p808 [Bacillus cereus]